MRSIDNLREWWRDRFPVMDRQLGCDFREHIDAIEREVKELRDRDYRNGMEDAAGAAEFADRLKAAVDKREDVTLFGVDYTALPVDADGVPIHIGERVQLIGNDPSTVSYMSLVGDGWRVYVKYDGDLGTGSGQPSRIRHHRAPTVEDVLREFAYGLGVPVADSYVAATAAKLRLKEG